MSDYLVQTSIIGKGKDGFENEVFLSLPAEFNPSALPLETLVELLSRAVVTKGTEQGLPIGIMVNGRLHHLCWANNCIGVMRSDLQEKLRNLSIDEVWVGGRAVEPSGDSLASILSVLN